MLEPFDESDKAASDFIEQGKSDLHLNCDPRVYFRARILFFRHHAHELGLLTEEEYISARKSVLDELVGQTRATIATTAIVTLAVLFAILYLMGLARNSTGRIAFWMAFVGAIVWIGLGWRSSNKYTRWIGQVPMETRLAILDSLCAEGIIDQDCRARYVLKLGSKS